MYSSSSEIYKKTRSIDTSSMASRPKMLRSISLGGKGRVSGMPRVIKNSSLNTKTQHQSLVFFPICFPIKITSQPHRHQNSKDEKRSKSESHLGIGPTKVDTPDCPTLKERKRSVTELLCKTLDIKKNIQSLTTRPDSTSLFKRRKSITTSATQTENGKRRSSLNEDKDVSETVYAIYDSGTSSPRLVTVKNDTNITSTQIQDKIEYVIDSDEGFQDIDLSLDPSTLNLSWNDYDFL